MFSFEIDSDENSKIHNKKIIILIRDHENVKRFKNSKS